MIPSPNLVNALSRTCRQIRQETQHYSYVDNKFCFYLPGLDASGMRLPFVPLRSEREYSYTVKRWAKAITSSNSGPVQMVEFILAELQVYENNAESSQLGQPGPYGHETEEPVDYAEEIIRAVHEFHERYPSVARKHTIRLTLTFSHIAEIPGLNKLQPVTFTVGDLDATMESIKQACACAKKSLSAALKAGDLERKQYSIMKKHLHRCKKYLQRLAKMD